MQNVFRRHAALCFVDIRVTLALALCTFQRMDHARNTCHLCAIAFPTCDTFLATYPSTKITKASNKLNQPLTMCIIHWTMHTVCNCEHIHRTPSYCDAFAIAHPQYCFEEKLITYIPALADLHLDRDRIHFRGHLLGEEKRPDGLSCPNLETRFELPRNEGCPLCGQNQDVVMTMQEAKLAYEERVDIMQEWKKLQAMKREVAELKEQVATWDREKREEEMVRQIRENRGSERTGS